MVSNFPLLNSDQQFISIEILRLKCNLCLDELIDVLSNTLKDLSVTFDCNLSFEKHISRVFRTVFFNLRHIAKLRNMLCLLVLK